MKEENNNKEKDEFVDELTGCPSKYQLLYDLWCGVMNAVRERTRYRNSFLCIDIDNFMRYGETRGQNACEQVLVRIAASLRSIYSTSAIYRYGGDEFVVSGVKNIDSRITGGADLELKYAVVEIDTPVEEDRHHRALSWVWLHIHAGVVLSSQQGIHIQCGGRDEEESWGNKILQRRSR